MKVHVKYTAQLRAALQRAEDTVELPTGTSLLTLLTHLAERDQAGRAHLLSSSGQANANLLIVVNESAIQAGNASSVELKAGDTVLLLPPIAGG